MIARIWHGWTNPESADAYEALLTGTILPDIVTRKIHGLTGYEVLRRPVADEIEFTTIIWFEDEKCIEGFVGKDSTLAHVPETARKLLSRWDERAVHAALRKRTTL